MLNHSLPKNNVVEEKESKEGVKRSALLAPIKPSAKRQRKIDFVSSNQPSHFMFFEKQTSKPSTQKKLDKFLKYASYGQVAAAQAMLIKNPSLGTLRGTFKDRAGVVYYNVSAVEYVSHVRDREMFGMMLGKIDHRQAMVQLSSLEEKGIRHDSRSPLGDGVEVSKHIDMNPCIQAYQKTRTLTQRWLDAMAGKYPSAAR
jgi:hypothetical protein